MEDAHLAFDDLKESVAVLLAKHTSKLEKQFSTLFNTCETYRCQNSELQTKLAAYENVKNQLEMDIKGHLDNIENLNKKITSLESNLVRYEEEISSMRRVSQIILYEKENARLQTQVKALEDKIKKLQVQPEPQAEDLEVYEKTINKIVYYISNDEAKRIFVKNSDGEIGEEVGKLVPRAGKLKPEWKADINC